MQHLESTFTGDGGLSLYRQEWRPDGAPRAAVVLVHGVGEHSGHYANVVEPMVDAGYAVFAHDHRGHGRSEGRRVHVDRWAEYRDDLAAHIAIVSEELPDVPLFVYGHSMGSIVVLDYLLNAESPARGMIISGVATQPVGVGSPALVAVARVLTHVTPKLSVDLHISSSSLSRDPLVQEAYAKDSLAEPRATVRWGTEILSAVDSVKAGSAALNVPALIVHGEADPLNSVQGARDLFAALPNPDKTLRIYPEVLHEPHSDIGHERLAADVVEWLGAHS